MLTAMKLSASLYTARRWVAASRPGFLLVTLLAAMVGVTQALACGARLDAPAAVATVLLALLTHAAANLYNDYGDAVGGSDAVNTERLFPFTGGSRVVQNGEFSAAQVRRAAMALGLTVVYGGVLLVARAGLGLVVIGLAGLTLGWAYSSPRVALMSRGLGELAVAVGWWLIVVGADYVQRHAFGPLAMLSGVSVALLATAILWAAEFPDAQADAQVGKRTLVVRWGPRRAALGYGVLVLLAHAWLAAWWWADWLPFTAWWALGSLPLSVAAAGLLWSRANQVARLRPVMELSIAAVCVHAALLTGAFIAIARMR